MCTVSNVLNTLFAKKTSKELLVALVAANSVFLPNLSADKITSISTGRKSGRRISLIMWHCTILFPRIPMFGTRTVQSSRPAEQRKNRLNDTQPFGVRFPKHSLTSYLQKNSHSHSICYLNSDFRNRNTEVVFHRKK